MYDPKVSQEQILKDLNYLAEQNLEFSKIKDQLFSNRIVHNEPYSAINNSHAVVILTEWDEFKSYNWNEVYHHMLKSTFVFEGRNILDEGKLKEIGFEYQGIGKG